ncbi:hypothetical protein BC834DRAFT_884645 [Gloeopeniophorella convolvens]|nr:hypothetical protein BC834DRAFT_884645 [Gloeopeniophorella convolvens]
MTRLSLSICTAGASQPERARRRFRPTWPTMTLSATLLTTARRAVWLEVEPIKYRLCSQMRLRCDNVARCFLYKSVRTFSQISHSLDASPSSSRSHPGRYVLNETVPTVAALRSKELCKSTATIVLAMKMGSHSNRDHQENLRGVRVGWS